VRTFTGAACPPGGVERGPTYSAAASANYCVGSTGGPGSGCCIDLSCTILDQTADGYLNTGPLTETPYEFLSLRSGGSSHLTRAQLPHPGLKHLDMPNVVNVGGHVVGGGSGDCLEHVSMPVAKKLAHGTFYSIGGGERSGAPAKACGQASCTGLKVYMPEVEEIGSSCFSGSSLSGIVNMPSVLDIKGYAFQQCLSITGVIMPKVRTIGYQAFMWGPWLTDVTLPKDCRQGPADWTSPPVTSNFIPGQVFPNGNSNGCQVNGYLGKSPCVDGKWPDTTITREGCSGGAASVKSYTRHAMQIRPTIALTVDELASSDPPCVGLGDWTFPYCRTTVTTFNPQGLAIYPNSLAIGLDRCKAACNARSACKVFKIVHPTRGTSAECSLYAGATGAYFSHPYAEQYSQESTCP
jgi:hypothetical protein